MIRFIIKKREYNAHSGAAWEEFYTIDQAVNELEDALTDGGHGGESGYQIHELIGVEIIPD